MKIVRILSISGDGSKENEIGRIALKGGILTPSSDSPILRSILQNPVRAIIKGKRVRVTAEEHPEEFLDNLHRQYTSVYLYTSKPEDSEFTEMDKTSAIPNRGG